MNHSRLMREVFTGPTEAERKLAAWRRTRPTTLAHNLPNDYRLDELGHMIRWSEHGPYTRHGWHIDHHPVPRAFGGTDDPDNLRALHWQANCSHGGRLGRIFTV